jgi:hypothetical protein
MPVLSCYVDDRTMHILQRVSTATGRKVEDLAESAISEAALREVPSDSGDARRQGSMI